jgi:hypothetical protein
MIPLRKAPAESNRQRRGADNDHRKGHGGFACWNIGTEIWGPDVMSSIDAVLKR